MRGNINRFSMIANILNRGSSIVVDGQGVEEGVPQEVKAAWYSGKGGNYQKRITAPWLVDPLLSIANDLRMRLSLLKPDREGGPYYLECLIGRGKHHGYGYCRLNICGVTHQQNEALFIIKQAVFGARSNYQAVVAIIVEDQHYPQTFEARDPLLAMAGQ